MTEPEPKETKRDVAAVRDKPLGPGKGAIVLPAFNRMPILIIPWGER